MVRSGRRETSAGQPPERFHYRPRARRNHHAHQFDLPDFIADTLVEDAGRANPATAIIVSMRFIVSIVSQVRYHHVVSRYCRFSGNDTEGAMNQSATMAAGRYRIGDPDR
jgi:hypothetical protein